MRLKAIGTAAERRTRAELEAASWFVIRSAASLYIDLVAIKAGKTVLVECKSVYGTTYYPSRHNASLTQMRAFYDRCKEHAPKGNLTGCYAIEFRGSGDTGIRYFTLEQCNGTPLKQFNGLYLHDYERLLAARDTDYRLPPVMKPYKEDTGGNAQ